MKKLTTYFLVIILSLTFLIPSFAMETEEDNISVIMAINESVADINGEESLINPPIMVFDKTYVDLFNTAPILGLDVTWVEAYIGFSRVTVDGQVYDFTLINDWKELKNNKYKFFPKDSVIYVSLRELAELAEIDISYSDGVITLGSFPKTDWDFGKVNTDSIDDYIYLNYPGYAQYVINPYQEYSYEKMITDVEKLKQMYPELIKTSSIGKSVEGRDLTLVEFGRGDKKIFVCGTHHGREYITTTYLMYAIDRYSYAYRTNSMWNSYNVKEILNSVTFVMVPMVNPDGVNLVINGLYATKNPDSISKMGIYEGSKYGYRAWKANVNGVDLNWNYNKDWTIEKNRNKRGSVGFNGDHPYSEPETIAVSDFVDNNEFYAYMSFHTQGEIFYWADNPDNPSGINKLIGWDTGFKEYKDEGKGVGGSFFDYVYRKFQKPTITVELCPYIGNFPYPDKDFDTVWKPAQNVLLIMGSNIK